MAAPLPNPLPLPIGRPKVFSGRRAATLRWALACGLTVLPLTAILHHAVFYRSTCMLNNFGADYTGAVVARWLSRDPSLWLAMLIALATFQLGSRLHALRPLVLPFSIAFLPLTLWVWDIPFTGRVICHHLHDGRVLLAEGMPLRAPYLYFLGAGLYGVQLARLAWRRFGGLRSHPAKPTDAVAAASWEGEHAHTAA